MTRVLVTGFGPFPGMPVNPSAELARRLGRSRRLARASLDVTVEILETRYDVVADLLPTILSQADADIVLMLGVAARTAKLRVEERGIKCVNMLTPDAGGACASVTGAGLAAALVTRVSVIPCVTALGKAGLPARRSNNAGRYLCNAGYYEALRLCGRRTPVLFVHVPRPAPQAGRVPRARRRSPRPTLAAMERGLVELVLRVAAGARAHRSRRARSAQIARHAA